MFKSLAQNGFTEANSNNQIVKTAIDKMPEAARAYLEIKQDRLRGIEEKLGVSDTVLFGGSIRNSLLGIPVNDDDIAVNIFTNAEYAVRLMRAYNDDQKKGVFLNCYRGGSYISRFLGTYDDIVDEMNNKFCSMEENRNESGNLIPASQYHKCHPYGGSMVMTVRKLKGENAKVEIHLGDAADYEAILKENSHSINETTLFVLEYLSPSHVADSMSDTLSAVTMKADGTMHMDHRTMADISTKTFRFREDTKLCSDRLNHLRKQIPGMKAVIG
jgi:hypothetical protein